MLVLSRKSGERIHIGDDVVLTVVKISGDRVSLSIEAPGHVRIMREEIAGDVEAPDREAVLT